MKRFVAEITLVVDAIGTEETFYFATSGFTTKPSDTPANTVVSARLANPGTYRRELFSGSRVAGAVRPSFGELVIINADGGCDDFAGYGISGGRAVVRRGEEDAAYPGGYSTVYVGYAQSMVADFDAVRLRLRDRLNLLEQPLVKTSFAGTGGLEGTTALAGKLKQWVSDDPAYFQPELIDRALQLYFVQSTCAIGVTTQFVLYEGGAVITRGADYASAADCLATAPAAGQCRFWFGVGNAGPVYVRLGSVPVYDLRVNAIGYQTSGAAWTLAAMAGVGGITGGTGTVGIGAILVDDSRSILQVMQDACAPSMAYFGMTRLDVFVSGLLAAPTASPKFTFTQHNAKGWTRSPIQDMDAPVWQVTMHAGKTFPSNLVSGASTTLKDLLSRTPWFSSFSGEDADIKTANPGAVAAVIQTDVRAFQSALSQTNFKTAFFALFGVRREFYTFTVEMDLNDSTATTPNALDLELHDTVEIKLPRYGLNAGKDMRIVTQQIDCKASTITYGVWG